MSSPRDTQLIPDRDLPGRRPRLTARTVAIEPSFLLPVAVLYAHLNRVYWSDPTTQTITLGLGTAAAIDARGPERFAFIREQAEKLFAGMELSGSESGIEPRLWGGFAFDDVSARTSDPLWDVFPAAHFHIPRLTFTISPDGAWLTAAQYGSAPDTLQTLIEDTLAQAREAGETMPMRPYANTLSLLADQPTWNQMVTSAVREIRAGQMEKVVLARAVELHYPLRLEPASAVDSLQDQYNDCVVFMMEPSPGNAFFGATPEVLVRKQGKQFETAALAGSRKRGKSDEDDARAARELLASDKDRREHAFVVEEIERRVGALSTSVNMPQTPGILKLKNIQHLHTPITGTLSGETHVVELVELLHPTPALGGTPREMALEALRRLEPTARGWYAAPVGMIDRHGNGMFAVAIRSGVSAGKIVRLYAGAGIVDASDPDAEWAETSLKLRPLYTALGLDT
ncbi:MAG: isochorismate synthase [Pleurocapsa minor GSE-CHR-MK-17-07R]|jgi:menaquinone-specific isochorismate synthase|nr:isochorismate synthase [Pleurocapsa minor GSE-CHR-MK 17-07R]